MPAATVRIIRVTGATGTSTVDITSTNTVANAEDKHFSVPTGSANPVRIPASGTTNYSYWVTTRLQASTAPSGTIDNLRWYSSTGSGNFGTGVSAVVGQAQTYAQANGTIGTTGTQLTTGSHPGLYAAPVDPYVNYPNATQYLAVTGSINANTGQFGNYVVYQLAVTYGASPGPTGQETFTWLYDET